MSSESFSPRRYRRSSPSVGDEARRGLPQRAGAASRCRLLLPDQAAAPIGPLLDALKRRAASAPPARTHTDRGHALCRDHLYY